MRAAFIAVGSELLGSESVDTNSLRVAKVLAERGVRLDRKSVVGDEVSVLASEIEHHLGRYDLVLLSGGLGPTSDDVTRRAVAAACGRRLSVDESVVADIRSKFARFGRSMPEVNRRQAEIIEGAELLPNRAGTAPGQRLDCDGTTLFLLPGVPRELEAMLEAVREWLPETGSSGTRRRVVKVACVAESELEERLSPLYEEIGRDRLAVYSRPGDLRVVVSAEPGEDRENRSDDEPDDLDRVVDRIRELVGPAVYSEEGEDLEEVVGVLLEARGLTLATAESCTGGLVGGRLTSVPGSSAWYRGGIVAYADDVKRRLLGVAPETLAAHGAVSEPVAREMATGARECLHAHLGLSVTGIAGPSGGSEEKPVGLVHLALATDGESRHLAVRFPGDRRRVREHTVQLGLEMVRRHLLGAPVGTSISTSESVPELGEAGA